MAKAKARHWSHDVHAVLKSADVRQVAYVPDGGLARLIELCNKDRTMRSVVLTTEEEGIAQMAGAWLGGERGVFLTQSGGVGNCINMLSIIQECRIPLLALVSMRGQWGEGFPWQVPMGQATTAALEAANVIVQPVDRAEEVAETVEAATRLAYDANRAVAVVVSQRITNSGRRG
ncbi:MAG: thiamine pyrophosphate-binding protein [Alphaproteobacteria bacterium]|nr:thiamine pyrophosphate-binding protein [Alphaproteobacteria bacterium]